MDSSLYKEISYKIQGFRIVSWLIAAVSLLLCLLIGIGCYILIIGMHGKEAFPDTTAHDDRITIVEGQLSEPLAEKSIQQIDFKDGIPSRIHEEGVEPVGHLQLANKFLRKSLQDIEEEPKPISAAEIHPHSYKTAFSMRYPMVADTEIENPSEDTQESILEALRMLDSLASRFGQDDDDHEGMQHRIKRSLGFGVLSYIPYISYASFGKFFVSQVSQIAEYNMESRAFQSRKLGGDPEADFLDGLWPFSSQDTSKTVKKASADQSSEREETTELETDAKPTNQKWQPLVNQVPITFVAEILRTLLNLMKEFLMKDHVMECLWYMFCQDVNHTAKHNDIYGILSRINSVGLKVLTESEQQLREEDTFTEVWRSVTAWTPLQCDVMFPRCDGPKALEIVNDVALGSS